MSSRGLLRSGQRVLVACSGGPDSQALLHVLWALRAEHGCSLSVASVDHGLRPDAHQDVAVAGRLAAALGLPFSALRVQVAQGASRQAQARAARYSALLAAARQQGAACVAVGHTLDDQAETVLARLVRGTSIEGLSAIAPFRDDGVVRPLIDAARAVVHAYLAEHALEFVSDPSNTDTRYLRVRLRRELWPLLLRENPQINKHLGHLADDAREAAEQLAAQADRLIVSAMLDLQALRDAAGSERRRALKRWVERETRCVLHRQHIVALERMLWAGGEVRLPGGVLAKLDAGRLTFVPVSKRGRGMQRPNKQPNGND